uniref:probable WRKY transcription factor 19 n=1 Tax=Fragaria vesca subsp. vesca TaxID=101020 RepID=UPI0005C87F51|nr:PREDICTED: probable WRKY transcription factor 19 [Fragaria vesca subsp. vesca]
MDKQIFLDIACFFNGEDDARVEKILKGCGFSSRIGINILVNKCLVKIERGKLWMHDLLRCLGWHIVRRESPAHPGNRSRLWLDDNEHKYETRRSWRIEDARNVLTENTGTTAVESLFLSLPEKEVIRLNSDPFLTTSKLRLLKICNVNFKQDVPVQYPSIHLRLLEWHECPLESLSSWFSSRQRLVELKIPNSRIERLWDESVYQLNSLIHMDLSNCRCLTMTPDFSAVPNLETLILEDCTELSEVHWSTMRLQHLVLLNLKGCVNLKELPDIIELRCLRTFVLSGCTNLRVFPYTADHMETLIELFLDGTAIEHLIGLPYVHLRSLALLNLSGCKNLRKLPFSTRGITGMTSLKFLCLSSCSRMTTLSDDIHRLEFLEELDVCDTAIVRVPVSISSLKNFCVSMGALDYACRTFHQVGHL